jgi:DNA-binding XRE family transcriptional regulator
MNNIELLKNSRKVLELKQDELAKRLGVTRLTVARWETEQRTPADEVFKIILDMVLEKTITARDREAFINSTVERLNK